MRRTFPFQDLSNDEFEDLISGICQSILGTGTIVFATGRDGGRDAAFTGTAQKFPSVESPLKGKFIIQAKHTANPAASCSDSEFSRILDGEKPKIVVLIEAGELEHYLCFTNRKKPADDAVAKEKSLRALGIQNAHLLGIEQIRAWLTQHPEVWQNLGFDRFETPFRIQTADLTAVITAFHDVLNADKDATGPGTFSFVAKPQKNKINKLSDAYFEEIRTRSLPYFKPIEDFLKNPRNTAFKAMYEDTADEIRRKLIAVTPPFGSFDEALTYVVDLVTASNPALNGRRRFAAIFMHYMYSGA
jgi:hypothetical protein